MFIKLILSTDLSKHHEYMSSYITDDSNLSIMMLIIKLADLAHVLRPFHVHLYWVYKLQSELHSKMTVSEIAIDTIRFATRFVAPMLSTFHTKYANIPERVLAYRNNITMWEAYYIDTG